MGKTTKAEMREINENIRKRSQMFSEMEYGNIVSKTSEDNTDEFEGLIPAKPTYEAILVRRRIEGSLADAIRNRLNADDDEPVFITERTQNYDLSELTAETDHRHIIECDGHRKEFDHSIPIWNFEALLRWLDGEEDEDEA